MLVDVRFGSLADMAPLDGKACFTPESDREGGHRGINAVSQCPLFWSQTEEDRTSCQGLKMSANDP